MKTRLTATWKWARHAGLEDLDPFPSFSSDEIRSRLWAATPWRQEPGDQAPQRTESRRWRVYVWVAAGNSEDIVLPEVELDEITLHGGDVDAKALWLTVTGDLDLDQPFDLADPEVLFELKMAIQDCLCVYLEIPRDDAVAAGHGAQEIDAAFGANQPVTVSFDEWDGLELELAQA